MKGKGSDRSGNKGIREEINERFFILISLFYL